MAVVDVYNTNGEKTSEIELNSEIFDVEVKGSILNDYVTMQLAKKRSGTAKVKRRSDVAGSTRKLFRQKGTGRARRGDIKSPLLRGGGVVFGPEPRSYEKKMPKKVKKLALKMALSSKYQNGQLRVLDRFELDEIKTKKFNEIVNKLDVSSSLFITESKDRTLELSSRNLPKVKVMSHEGLNVFDILKYDHLILLQSSISGIEGRFSS